jgi:TRAP-type C4-dicarboxylate transport system substrate-binding protein
MRAVLGWTTAIAIGVLAAGCGGGDKAGGEGGVKTLRLATPDRPGPIGSEQAERFAEEVRRRSDGRLRVQIVWQANRKAVGGFEPGWDQTTAALVRDGEYELGLIPARAWDTLGVTSLQALQAPFLIDSAELAGKVARSAAAGQMLDGLGKAGVVGLALLPEELRHPVAFGPPLRGPSTYEGRQLRVPRSDASYQLMRALGARPVDLNGAGFANAVADKRVTGAEASLAGAGGLPARGTVSGNVTFYPKVNTLVAGQDAHDGLSEADRETLREAAEATLGHELPSEADSAAEACQRGVRVASASPADIAALKAAARPVYAELERDPRTRALIAGIREMKDGTPGPSTSAPECAPERSSGSGTSVAAADDPSVLNGVYRYEITEEALLDAGADKGEAQANYGVNTQTLRDGRFTNAWRSPDNTETCEGTYTRSGDRLEIRTTSTTCNMDVVLHYERTADGLRITRVVSVPPFDNPRDHAINKVLWSSEPWQRIR